MKNKIDLPMTLFICLCSLLWIFFSMNIMDSYGQFSAIGGDFAASINIYDTVNVEWVIFMSAYVILAAPFLMIYLVWELIPRILKKKFRALYHVFTALGMFPFVMVTFYSIPGYVARRYGLSYEEAMSTSQFIQGYSLTYKILNFVIWAIIILEIADIAMNFKKLSGKATLKKNITKGIAVFVIPVFFCIFMYGFLMVMYRFRPGYVDSVIYELTANTEYSMGAMATLIVIPIIEGLIFRGVIFLNLNKNNPYMVSIAISTLLWALWHGSWALALYFIPLGILLGYIYHHTKILRYSVVTHSVTNLLLGATLMDSDGFVLVLGSSILRRARIWVFSASLLNAFIVMLLGLAGVFFFCWLWLRD